MNSKRVLILGAAPFQVPIISRANSLGFTVYTVDNCPENPGHDLAEKSFNHSVTDKDAILKLAQRLNLDAVIGYASDVCNLTAVWVSHQLDLPTTDLNAVQQLSDKLNFKTLLSEQNLQNQQFEDLTGNGSEPLFENLNNKWPIVIKPVLSSGSKGISVVNHQSQLDSAIEKAKAAAIDGRIMAESYIQKSGRQVSHWRLTSQIFLL